MAIPAEILEFEGPYNVTQNGVTANYYTNIFTGDFENTSIIFSYLNNAANATYKVNNDTVDVWVNGEKLIPFDMNKPETVLQSKVILCPLDNNIIIAESFNDWVTKVNNKSAVKGWAAELPIDIGGGSSGSNASAISYKDFCDKYKLTNEGPTTLTNFLRLARNNGLGGVINLAINMPRSWIGPEITDMPGNIATSDKILTLTGEFDASTAICQIMCTVTSASANNMYKSYIGSTASAVASLNVSWYKYSGQSV